MFKQFVEELQNVRTIKAKFQAYLSDMLTTKQIQELRKSDLIACRSPFPLFFLLSSPAFQYLLSFDSHAVSVFHLCSECCFQYFSRWDQPSPTSNTNILKRILRMLTSYILHVNNKKLMLSFP